MNPRWWASHASTPRIRGIRKYSPNSATMMLGVAAIRSIIAMRVRRRRGGAYSEMNRAVASPTGIAMISATRAISTPRGNIAAMPNWLVLMNQVEVVKKRRPTALKAGTDCRARNARMPAPAFPIIPVEYDAWAGVSVQAGNAGLVTPGRLESYGRVNGRLRPQALAAWP